MRARYIIKFYCEAEAFLNRRSETFQSLGIKIEVIGTSIDGQFGFFLNSPECFVHFDNLKPEYFQLTHSATKYKVVHPEGKRLLERYLDADGNLDYLKFLESLLAELQNFLKEGQHIKGWNAKFDVCQHEVA